MDAPYRVLPERPSLEQLRKQAKDLHRAQRSGGAAAAAVLRRVQRWRALSDEELLGLPLTLSDAQFALALDYGLPSWVELKQKVELLRGERTLAAVRRDGNDVRIDGLPALGGARGCCTYAGALAAALRVTAQAYGYDQIMAYSGLAFRTRWFRGEEKLDWCPSSAIGELPPEMDAVSAVTGWRQRYDVRAEGRSELWPKLTASIDRGVPVLGYPSDEQLDLAVLCGYRRDGDDLQLIWLDYEREREMVVPASALGFLVILLERQGLVPDPRQALIAALASDNWRCRKRAVPGRDGAYRYGGLALQTWHDDLELASQLEEPLARKLCFVSSFCFAALRDARSAAATFLNQAADDFEDEIASPMRDAAACYAACCGAMLPAVREQGAFAPPWGPGFAAWDDAARARERAILREVLACEAQAERAVDAVLAAVG